MNIRRLNIFVDETGEFGFGEESSLLYGVSFTFHEQKDNIDLQLKNLNSRLERIGYTDMIHMADLIMHRNNYKKFDISKRKRIFDAIYVFSKRIPVKYKTIIIDKRYVNSARTLKYRLSSEIHKMISDHDKYFRRFDKVVMYYDNGQEALSTILDSIFSILNGYEHKANFNHVEKRLFQVSDMLTFIDKYNYKYKNKIQFTRGEKYFFNYEEIRKVLKALNKKRF